MIPSLLIIFHLVSNSWAQTTESRIDKSVFEAPLNILTSDISNLPNPKCEEEKDETEYFHESLEYECECELPENLKKDVQKVYPIEISSFSLAAGVGNDNHLFAQGNDDHGLTWYKEIMGKMDLKLQNGKTVFMSYDYFGGQYTQKLGYTIINKDGSKSVYSDSGNEEFGAGEASAEFEEFKYLQNEDSEFIWLRNQKSLSKTKHQLSGKYAPRPGYFLVSSVGNVAIDGDSNQKHAEKQQSHHKAMKIYNFNYEDYAGQVGGFDKNVNYVFGSVGVGKEFKGEFLKGNCTLKAIPEISLQKNIRLQGPKGTISSWQPKAMMTLEAGFLPAKNNKSQKKIEIQSNVKLDPFERLPQEVDPGNAGSVSASLKLNFYSKNLNFSKSAKNSYQIGFFLIPVSLSKGLGSSKNVLPSSIFQGANKNELMARWAVGGIVITPKKRKRK